MIKIRRKVFSLVDIPAPGDWISQAFDIFIYLLITLNVLAVITETTELGSAYKQFFDAFEVFSVTIFTIEYFLRIWSCPENPDYSDPIKGRIRFALSPLALIDLAAILPFFIPMIIPLDLRFLRMLRLIRIFRVLKLARYVDALGIFYRMFKNQKEELFITLAMGSMLLLFSSCLIYYAEHDAQPESFSSIPAALWWAVITLTTVGYGDIYPITSSGRFLGSVIAILGIGMIALPTGILASGLMEEINKRKNNKKVCPHCGEEIEQQ